MSLTCDEHYNAFNTFIPVNSVNLSMAESKDNVVWLGNGSNFRVTLFLHYLTPFFQICTYKIFALPSSACPQVNIARIYFQIILYPRKCASI